MKAPPALPALALPLLVALALAVPAGAAAATYHAAPFGSGTACSQATPCSLSTALAEAQSDGDVVSVASGNYGFVNTATNYTITHAITVEGASGVDGYGQPARPTIFSDAGPIIRVDDPTGSVTLRDLTLESLGSADSSAALELDSAASVERVSATAASGTGCKAAANAVEISDSVCLSTATPGNGGIGVDVEENSEPMTVRLRNDTVVQTGTNYGLNAQALFGALTLDVTNTIIASGNVSISAFAAQSGASVAVAVDHSNYAGSATLIEPCCGLGTAHVEDEGGNQTASPPQFRDAGLRDYHETAGSPTVNAGAAGGGSLDLDGNPRSFGAGPDIGAYEYLPPPAASTEGAEAGRTAATLHGAVEPEGVDTHYWFFYSTHSNLLESERTPAVDAGSGSGAAAVSAELTGLAPATTYYYEARAASGGGISPAGTIGSFRTTDVPAVVTGAAAGIEETAATIPGSVNPQGLDTTYSVRYGTSLAALNETAAGGDAGSGTAPEAVSVPLTGLRPGTTYYCVVDASNADGDSGNVDVQSFSTLPSPAVTVAAPRGIGAAGATIAGTIDPEGQSTEYSLEYRPAGAGAYSTAASGTLPAGSAPVAVSASLHGLAAASEYEWRIVAGHGGAGAATVTVAGAAFRTAEASAGGGSGSTGSGGGGSAPVTSPGPSPRGKPSNAFRLDHVRLHPARGTATLTVTVPGAGLLRLSGVGVLSARQRARKAGEVTLPVRPVGGLAARLGRRHRARARLHVSFEPDGGSARTRAVRLTLREKGNG